MSEPLFAAERELDRSKRHLARVMARPLHDFDSRVERNLAVDRAREEVRYWRSAVQNCRIFRAA